MPRKAGTKKDVLPATLAPAVAMTSGEQDLRISEETKTLFRQLEEALLSKEPHVTTAILSGLFDLLKRDSLEEVVAMSMLIAKLVPKGADLMKFLWPALIVQLGKDTQTMVDVLLKTTVSSDKATVQIRIWDALAEAQRKRNAEEKVKLQLEQQSTAAWEARLRELVKPRSRKRARLAASAQNDRGEGSGEDSDSDDSTSRGRVHPWTLRRDVTRGTPMQQALTAAIFISASKPWKAIFTPMAQNLLSISSTLPAPAFTYYKSQTAMHRIMVRLAPSVTAQGASDLYVMLNKKETDLESEEVQTLTDFAAIAWVAREMNKRSLTNLDVFHQMVDLARTDTSKPSQLLDMLEKEKAAKEQAWEKKKKEKQKEYYKNTRQKEGDNSQKKQEQRRPQNQEDSHQ